MAAMQSVKDEAKRTDTRQLLDELDALMDRMLALPIEDHEEPDVTPAGPVAAPIVSATLTLLDSPNSVAASEPPPTLEAAPVHYEVETSVEPALVAAATAAEPPAEEHMPAPMLATVGAPARFDIVAPPSVAAASRLRPGHLSYQFLLWINQGYDHGTNWLGKPGRALRSRLGRAMLGLAGLGLLALALAWLGKDWLGWNW